MKTYAIYKKDRLIKILTDSQCKDVQCFVKKGIKDIKVLDDSLGYDEYKIYSYKGYTMFVYSN